MHGSTEARPLKVLTPAFRAQIGTFNQTARALQGMGIRLHCLDLQGNRLVIAPEDANRLFQQELIGFPRCRSTQAGATYTTHFQGVTLEWFEPAEPIVH